MTLFKQLFIGVSILFFVLLAGVDAIYLANARSNLRDQLAANAQDAATTLALRLGALPALDDRALIEAIVSPVFDRGHFEEIRVLSIGGETLVGKSLPPSQAGVPEWFTAALSLGVPGAQTLVSSGWRENGRVVVASYPHFAYQQLWKTGLHTSAWLLLVYLVAIAAIMGFLRMLLRPLGDIEGFALSLGERNFTRIGLVPRTRELARVVLALNGMSEKIKRGLEEESVRAEALRRDAFVDPVTSLYNRRGFKLELQSLIDSSRDVFSGALAIVEIQNFGELNTRAGYQRGDEVLTLLGGVLAAACGEHTAVCGRLSGAGFVFAAINIDAQALQQVVAAVCRRIGFVLEAQGLEAGLRCHCGATRHEGALPPFSTMLASADMALERARAKGENEYEIEMLDEAAADGSQVWRARIERALDDNQIALFAQDAFGFPARTPVHCEVTARIIGADGEPVVAARFLPMAVRYGLIARLDCSVLEKLLALLAAEAKQPQNTDRGAADQNTMDQNVGYRKIMALNVSARTLADPGATQRLLELLEARRELAGRLVFEMTEFGASQNVELAQQFGAEVGRLGAHFALDNFGAQKDSLMLVHALKPHYIKLSPRYSRELAGNADCRFFVASIVRIARTLDIGIFAQAVEDETLVPLLAELGLSGYQGLVGARPQRIA